LKLKVGLVTTEFLPVWGGIGAYCFNLCRALSDTVEFHIFTRSRRIDELETFLEATELKVEVHPISTDTVIPFPILSYQLNLLRHLPRLIKEYDLALVHSAGPLADQLLRIRGITAPHVLTYHTTLAGQRQATINSGARFKDLHNSEKLTLLSYPLLKLYETMSLNRTENIIAVSKAVRNDLVSRYRYKGKVRVIPNGIDTNMFQPDRKAGETKKVLYVGRLLSWKGPRAVIEAMPLVLKQHKDAFFTFAGAGDREPYLRLLHERNISGDNFEFCNRGYQDIPRFYNSGDIMVLPSMLESLPMAILEAMSCGLPVVASDVGDVAELVHDGVTGFLIAAELMGRRTLEVYHKVLSDNG